MFFPSHSLKQLETFTAQESSSRKLVLDLKQWKEWITDKMPTMKSDYYPVNAAVSRGRMAHTLFSSPDQIWHRQLRKSIGSAFTVGAVARYEYLVDNTVRIYLDVLDKRYSGKRGSEGIIDLHTSLLHFAFDVIGDLTYGTRHGFIESGKDLNGIINYVVSFLNYGFIVSHLFKTISYDVYTNDKRPCRRAKCQSLTFF